MNNPQQADAAAGNELTSAMFASLVLQQSNMASISLGLAPHPQTGATGVELEHARYFIDQLEMLEVKTRGNLDKIEEALLKQSLTRLRLAFVEAASRPASPAPEAEPEAQGAHSAAPSAAPAAAAPAQAESAGGAAAADEDSRKKFSKKY
jgi:hypothetical protein